MINQTDRDRWLTGVRDCKRRGEEAAAGVEVAVLAGDADAAALEACLPAADRLVALLTGLCR
jgi:hypothetical protein